ncbi:MAG TPA: ABC transporter permease [Pyrinomonadaceae bacterium]|jgi:ABC-type transport system involved in multi-copper enzyme maturation permease subunit|nr:ABC transporter permease [Pyrinomonadaceae bacterium]
MTRRKNVEHDELCYYSDAGPAALMGQDGVGFSRVETVMSKPVASVSEREEGAARDGVDAPPPNAQAGAAASGVVRGTRTGRILTIARNAFREAVRDRVLYNLVLFVLGLVVVAIFVGELSAGQEPKIIVDLGLSAMLLFGTFISIFVGVGLVYKEIERRTVYAIFSKPVGRGEFLVGKYLGLCLTLFLNVAVMGLGITLALIYVRGGWNPLALSIWPAVLLIYLELTILTAVALLFSSFSTPALSALLTFFVFIIGHFSADLRSFAASMGTTSARLLFGALYYLLPNLSNYSFMTPAAYGHTPTPSALLGAIIYAVLYNVVLLSAATLIFNRRNFK